MNLTGIRALVAKDFTLFFRNRFFALITSAGPGGLRGNVLHHARVGRRDHGDWRCTRRAWSPALDEIQQQGLEIRVAESKDDLEDGVIAHDYVAGIGIPGDLMEKLASGQRPQIDLYFASDTPEEAQAAVSSLIRELIYAQTGQPLAVDFATAGSARPGHGGASRFHLGTACAPCSPSS